MKPPAMGVVGFNFTKIEANRDDKTKGKISIKNNVAISNVEDAKLSLGKTQQEGLKISFTFSSSYTPSSSKIAFEGYIVYMDDPAVISEIKESWKKDKKVPGKFAAPLLNQVLDKCNVEAIILSRDLNMPSPIPLPKVTAQKKSK